MTANLEAQIGVTTEAPELVSQPLPNETGDLNGRKAKNIGLKAESVARALLVGAAIGVVTSALCATAAAISIFCPPLFVVFSAGALASPAVFSIVMGLSTACVITGYAIGVLSIPAGIVAGIASGVMAY